MSASTGTFEQRVAYAILCLYTGEDSRERDNCYEMHDGDMVVTSIIRKARTVPALRDALVRDWGIGSFESHPWHETAGQYEHLPDDEIPKEAKRIRDRCHADFEKWLSEHHGKTA